MSVSPRCTEPLTPGANGELAAQDDEAPSRWGSCIDKVWLVPFFAVAGALVFYGVQGIQEFDAYLVGNAQAEAFCAPLGDVQNQCADTLSMEVAKATRAIDGGAAGALTKGTKATKTVHSIVKGACRKVANGVGACDKAIRDVLPASTLTLPTFPELPGNSDVLSKAGASGDVGEVRAGAQKIADDLKQALSMHLETLSKQCAGIPIKVDALCTRVTDTANDVGDRVDAAAGALVAQSPQKLKELMMDAVDKATSRVCPALDAVPDTCAALRKSIQDALRDAASSAEEELPDEVPKDLLRSALRSATDLALTKVGGMCDQASAIARNCSQTFGSAVWRPLLDKLRIPLEALQDQLRVARNDFLEAISASCESLKSTASLACGQLAHRAEKAVSEMEQAARDVVANAKGSAKAIEHKVTARLQLARESLKSRLSSARGSLQSKLFVVQKTLGTLTDGCGQAASRVETLCDDLDDVWATFDALADRANSGVHHILGLGSKVQDGCAQLGTMRDSCIAVANPVAALAEGGSALWQHKAAELMQLEAYLLVTCIVCCIGLMGLIRYAAWTPIIFSVFANLASVVFLCIWNLMTGNLPTALFFGCLFLAKAMWFWCLWPCFRFAATLIQCAVHAVEAILGVGIWLLCLFVLIVQVGLLALAYGTFYHLTGPQAPPETQFLGQDVDVAIVFALVWTTEVAANVLHVTVCCGLGGACGVLTPAKTCCGSTCFALIGALGSIAAGSFWIALLKALQYLWEKSKDSENPCVLAIGKCLCCILEWALKMYNSYAFVFVGLKGASYCAAASRVFGAFRSNGKAALATDQALHDVICVAKLVSLYVSILVALMMGRSLNIITAGDSWQETFASPLACVFLASVTSFALSTTMGRLLEASVCTLFIVFEVFHDQMRAVQPELCKKLDDRISERSGGL